MNLLTDDNLASSVRGNRFYPENLYSVERTSSMERTGTKMAAPAARRHAITSVPAVERTAGILLALDNGGRDASLTELARLLGIHKSTAHGILATLARHEFVRRDPVTRRYRLGPALAALGSGAGDRQELATRAQPHLRRLRRLSGETATLHVRDRRGSLVLASEESFHQLKVTAPPGHRLPAFAGSVAKVFLASTRCEEALPLRLPAFTPKSITEPTRYRQELLKTERAGIALDDGEYLPGVCAISAPVRRGIDDARADVVGALSIVAVTARTSTAALRRLAGPLRSAARALSAALEPGIGQPSFPPLSPPATGRERRA
jgi:DNA-binding IclR family transcriptional regulator